jgi:hypothetical protein
MDEEQIKAFVEALATNIKLANDETVRELVGAVINPLLARVEAIATAQVALASVIRTNRRDYRATEFAKVLIQMRFAKGKQDDAMLHELTATAYQLSSMMETHAMVGEAQEHGRLEEVTEHVRKNPSADPVALARAFLGPKA